MTKWSSFVSTIRISKLQINSCAQAWMRSVSDMINMDKPGWRHWNTVGMLSSGSDTLRVGSSFNRNEAGRMPGINNARNAISAKPMVIHAGSSVSSSVHCRRSNPVCRHSGISASLSGASPLRNIMLEINSSSTVPGSTPDFALNCCSRSCVTSHIRICLTVVGYVQSGRNSSG